MVDTIFRWDVHGHAKVGCSGAKSSIENSSCFPDVMAITSDSVGLQKERLQGMSLEFNVVEF